MIINGFLIKGVPCVYMIRNMNDDKKYIGSAMDVKRRLNKHLSELRKNRHHSKHLQNAWNKYGEGCFEFFVILYSHTYDEILSVEKLCIDTFKALDPNFGYNTCTVSNSRKGIKHTEETKRKMSLSHMGKTWPEHLKKPKPIKIPIDMIEYGRRVSRQKGGKEFICVENNHKYYTVVEASKDTGICESSIRRSLKNKSKTKLTFIYLDSI